MEIDSESICPLEFRYGSAVARSIFTREATLRRYLAVEAALARALADEKCIPSSAAMEIENAVRNGSVRLKRVAQLELATKHDVMALVRALSEVSGKGARYVHMGATSNDILDTARGLEMKEATELLGSSLEGLIASLLTQAERHRSTPMAGRTHGQHAVPTTFGYKVLNFVGELLRHRRRLSEISKRLLVGKMSGAIGTGASFGSTSEMVERRVLTSLGLSIDEAPTQVTGRDRLAEFTFWMAMVASTLDRLATEVRNLQRTEIAELSEPFEESGQVGSSTMAQKRNPVSAENVSSLARLLRALPHTALENMVQWHERDLANSANERFLYSHGVVVLDEMLRRMKAIVDGWQVHEERMRRNMTIGGGSLMAEGLMLELTRRGMPRQEAHELLRNLTRGLEGSEGETLLARARSNRPLSKWFKKGELDFFCSPEAYSGAATKKTERLLKTFRAELARHARPPSSRPA